MTATLISDFTIQIKLRRFTSGGDKDFKRTGDLTPV